MPKSGLSGSVRGAPSNGRPYRDTVDDVSKALERRRNQAPVVGLGRSSEGACRLAERRPA